MLIEDRAAGLELYNKSLLENEVRRELAQDSSVFIKNLQWCLLLELNALFGQAVCKRVLVDLFEMSMSQVTMNCEPRFAHHIAQPHDVVHLCLLCFLVAMS
jgi:hypothetical protein